jgi:hypothetical protein
MGQRPGKLGAVLHGEVRPVPAKGRHQMGRVAEQSNTTPALPAVADRQSMDRSRPHRWPRSVNQFQQLL